jgi:hypothetical protein
MISTALYPSGCSGLANGAWKSTDLGLTWTRYTTGMPSEDPGHFNIDPNNVLRVAGTPHTPPGDLWESRDGGQTWTDMGGVCGTEGMVDSLAAKFWWIDEDHLLAVGGGDNTEAYGTCLGTRSGSTWPWTWSWVKVNTNQHFHAEEQVYFDPANGTIVEGGAFGIDVSTDHGVTWTAATMPDSYSSSIVGTATTLYSTANYASLGGFAPNYATASRSAPLTWTAGTLPSGMNNGWLNASVMCSGSNYIIVAGCWDAGLWRYVEPSTGACPGTVTSPKRIRFIKVG